MNNNEVFELVKKELYKVVPVKKHPLITQKSEFAYDLDLTSLDLAEVCINIEESKNIAIDDIVFINNLRTVEDLCNIVIAQLKKNNTIVSIKKTLFKQR